EAGQQAPFTTAAPPTVTNTEVSAKESQVQIGVFGPSTTLMDLAKVFQKLKVSATDMIAILDQLKSQGALKARVKVL
ncbi:MAG: flagellar basal body P-ring protein FlgI, partial [Armatimonadetes bacterium]|nr:flagellar basal body P-ring protein FlgI [Armatimonadota bacterium]